MMLWLALIVLVFLFPLLILSAAVKSLPALLDRLNLSRTAKITVGISSLCITVVLISLSFILGGIHGSVPLFLMFAFYIFSTISSGDMKTADYQCPSCGFHWTEERFFLTSKKCAVCGTYTEPEIRSE
jgi:hypothetical protein